MLDRQVRVHIADYLAGELDLDGLEERVVTETWSAEQEGDFLAAAIAEQVMFALTELGAGDISEGTLRERLMPLAPEWAVSTLTPETGSSSSSREERWLAGAAVVGRAREVASA